MTAKKLQKLEQQIGKVIIEIREAKTQNEMFDRLRRYSSLDRRYTKIAGTHYNPVTANLQDADWRLYG